ncbi:hypothetical protein, partial [Klebsiella aerogenes]
TLTDEGVNGLALHIVNERPHGLEASVEVTSLRAGKQPVVSGRRDLTLEPGQSLTLAATDLFGAFFDTTYA